MRTINDITLDSLPIIFLGSSTGMHNQIECCQARNREIVGIIDSDYPVDSEIHGLTILNPDKYLTSHRMYEFFVATTWSPFKDPIFIRNQEKRQKLLDFMSYHDLTGATLIHPTAVISPGARIGRNVSIGALSYISHGVNIESNVIVREQCFIGHDVNIGTNVVLQIKSTVTGLTNIESDTYIGVNSTVINRMPLTPINIGKNCLIYPNELVLTSVPKNNTVFTRKKRG